MKIYLGLTYLLFSFNANALPNGTRIVGKAIKSPLVDQVCHLELNNGDSICSGVRISNDYVLTAQHCARSLSGKKNSINLSCNNKSLDIEEVYESKEFLKKLAESNGKIVPSAYDFSLIKIKNPKSFVPKFKMLRNLAEYQSIFLNSADTTNYNFSENTYCEFHGYGLDAKSTLDNFNSTFIETSEKYNGALYLMKAVVDNGNAAYLQSPLLPENNLKFIHSTARPGDSGGPIFCKSKSGEMILSGVASTFEFGVCPEQFQTEGRRFKINCNDNVWGLPTKESLENTLGIKIDI